MLSFIRARQLLEPVEQSQTEDDIIAALGSDQDVALETGLAGLELLKQVGSKRDVLERYVQKAKEIWPEATVLDREAAR